MRYLLVLLLIAVAAPAQTTTHKKTVTKAPAKRSTMPAKNPVAIIDTTAGKFTCTLFRDKVPHAVDNFIGLATGSKEWTDPETRQKKKGVPYYNGTIFHRVIPNFMIQGGDIEGTGQGGPGYTINDEFSPDLNFDQPGVLAYANSGPNTNGSQFFITEIPTPWLNPCLDKNGCERGSRQVPQGYGYTIFGQCDQPSVELVKTIAREPSDPSNNRPDDPVKINKITIVGHGAAAAKKAPVHARRLQHKPATPSPKSSTSTPKK